MAFEIVVRPIIFPDIRPAPARMLAPEDDPKKGICVIAGTSVHSVTLSHSTSWSVTHSNPVETERRVDEVRVSQKNEDGSINKSNFVDIEVANRITMKDPDQSDPKKWYWTRIEESDNIEVKRRDVIKRQPFERY
jgi:hypothetical protein